MPDLRLVPAKRIRARLALPGAGTLVGSLAAATEVLSEVFDFDDGYAGTSGGGIIALARARGKTPEQVSTLVRKYLKRKDLLDNGWLTLGATGIYRGKVIEGLLAQELGIETTMGGLKHPCRVTVSSMWTRKPAVICSQRHPLVLAHKAGRATSGIQGIFDLVRLRADNPRTYGDGGLGVNVPAGIWDDKPGITVFLRFRNQEIHGIEDLLSNGDGDSDPNAAKAVRNKIDVAGACVDMALNSAAASFPTRKPNDQVFECVVEAVGDSLDFSLSDAQIEGREKAGEMSAKRFVAANLARLRALAG